MESEEHQVEMVMMGLQESLEMKDPAAFPVILTAHRSHYFFLNERIEFFKHR